MRKLKLAAIILLGMTALLLSVQLGLYLLQAGTASGMDGRDCTLARETAIPAGDIRSLEIDYQKNSNEVFFYQGEGEDILIREYLNFTPKENQLSIINQEDSVLLIKGVNRRFFFSLFSIGNPPGYGYTEIYLPPDLMENLEDLSVKTLSGSVHSDIPLGHQGSFKASSTSGDLLLESVNAAQIHASTVSGDIRFDKAQADTVQVSTTSGNIEFDTASGDTILISTTSGDTALDKAEGSLTHSSASGDLQVNRLNGDLESDTISGSITMGQAEGLIDLTTSSGEIRLQKGQGSLSAQTTSGDVQAESLTGTFQIHSTSGCVSILSGSSHGTAKTVSGDVDLCSSLLEGKLTISTTSGDVNLSLPPQASLTLDFSSTSGECSTFFDHALSYNKKCTNAQGAYNGGEHAVSVSTLSGSLQINQY